MKQLYFNNIYMYLLEKSFGILRPVRDTFTLVLSWSLKLKPWLDGKYMQSLYNKILFFSNLQLYFNNIYMYLLTFQVSTPCWVLLACAVLYPPLRVPFLKQTITLIKFKLWILAVWKVKMELYKTAHASNTQHGVDTWNVKRYIYMLLKYNCFIKISFIKNKNDERNYNNVSLCFISEKLVYKRVVK
jgi:hypothetical protein